jgi:hypothetical protein
VILGETQKIYDLQLVAGGAYTIDPSAVERPMAEGSIVKPPVTNIAGGIYFASPRKKYRAPFCWWLGPKKHPFGGILKRQQTPKCKLLNKRGLSSPIRIQPVYPSSIDLTIAEGFKDGVYRRRDVAYSAVFGCLAVLATAEWEEFAELAA